MRLGDLDALEKRMKKRLNFLLEAYSEYDEYIRGFDEGCVAVKNAPTIDPATLAPRWRNAKTDPPKEDGEYLVYMSSGRYMLLRWNNKGHIWTGNGLNYTKQKTEWWAELPQSPKRG